MWSNIAIILSNLFLKFILIKEGDKVVQKSRRTRRGDIPTEGGEQAGQGQHRDQGGHGEVTYSLKERNRQDKVSTEIGVDMER